MNNYVSVFAFCLLVIVLAAAGVLLFASPALAHDIGKDVLSGGFWGPLLTCSAAPGDVEINPSSYQPVQCGFCELLHTVQHFIYFGITLVVYAFAPVLLAVGGLFILLGGGSPEWYGKGKSIVTGTIYGLAITLGAFIIVNTFITLIGPEGVNWTSVSCS